MSTRSNVLLRTPNGASVYFYRHCDGYLSVTGRSLHSIWTAMMAKSPAKPTGFPWIGDFATRLLLARDEQGDAMYTMTAGPHSDSDYFYCFDFPGFTDDDTRDLDYAKARDLLRIRWARGFGKDLPQRAMDAAPRTPEEFWRDIATNADRDEAA